jgi:hypothetical protein
MKIEGSGSASGTISQGHGSADPDPHQNVMDPQHCFDPSASLGRPPTLYSVSKSSESLDTDD